MKTFQLIFISLLISFCSTPKTEETAEESNDQLTYMEFYNLVIQETGERVEWHGEEMDKSAAPSLSISQNGKCGEADCGDALFVSNASSDSIEFIIQAPYNIDGVESHLATTYRIQPNGKISIGCSHLCYQGESYLLERRIVAAKVIVSEKTETSN